MLLDLVRHAVENVLLGSGALAYGVQRKLAATTVGMMATVIHAETVTDLARALLEAMTGQLVENAEGLARAAGEVARLESTGGGGGAGAAAVAGEVVLYAGQFASSCRVLSTCIARFSFCSGLVAAALQSLWPAVMAVLVRRGGEIRGERETGRKRETRGRVKKWRGQEKRRETRGARGTRGARDERDELWHSLTFICSDCSCVWYS